MPSYLDAVAGRPWVLPSSSSWPDSTRSCRSPRARRPWSRAGWRRRLLHRRGALVIVAGRYLPGGRSATAVAAAVAGYPAARFHRWTALGVLLWAAQAALLGYLGGAVFAGRPLLGLLLAWLLALSGTGLALLVQRLLPRQPAATRATASVHPRRTP